MRAIVALVMLALSGPGTRFDAWSYRTGFVIFRYSAYVAIVAIAVAAAVLAIPATRRIGIALPIFALILAAAVLYVPLQLQSRARSVPPINDITTDTSNPPQYMTTARAYPGAEFARQQRA